MLTASRRRYLYHIMAAAAGLAVGYGIISQNEASLWLALGVAALGIPVHELAAKNVFEDE